MKNKQETDRTAEGRFAEGKSGNPAGRPRGSRNKSTMLIEALLAEESERLTRKAIELAMNGDGQALRLCMERLVPPRKDRTIDLQLPAIETLEQIPEAFSIVNKAIGDGQITPLEGETLTDILAKQLEMGAARDLLRRVERLEQRLPTEKSDSAQESVDQQAITDEIEWRLNEPRRRNAAKKHLDMPITEEKRENE